MSLSGWCGQRGTPDHHGCRSPVCSCVCHDDDVVATGLIPDRVYAAETVTLTSDAL